MKFILSLPLVLLALVLMPVSFIFNRLLRPKTDYSLIFSFSLSEGKANFIGKLSENELSKKEIIKGSLLYYAKFLALAPRAAAATTFIQISEVGSEKNLNIQNLNFKILEGLKESSLSAQELHALQYVKIPLDYATNSIQDIKYKNVFRYNLNRKVSGHYEMSSGPQNILLPISCGILYQYLVKTLNDDEMMVFTSALSILFNHYMDGGHSKKFAYLKMNSELETVVDEYWKQIA